MKPKDIAKNLERKSVGHIPPINTPRPRVEIPVCKETSEEIKNLILKDYKQRVRDVAKKLDKKWNKAGNRCELEFINGWKSGLREVLKELGLKE